jgi:hypothetical protein
MFKGRKFSFILLFGILSMLLLFSVSIPLSFKSKAFVPYTLDKTMQQLRMPEQLGKWFFPFANIDTALVQKITSSKPGLSVGEWKLIVENASPAQADLSLSYEGTDRIYNFIVSPDPRGNKNCIVTMPINNTFWKRMVDPDPIDEIAIRSIKNLNDFTNDTKRYYGFRIRREKVTDSSFLYITTAIRPDFKAVGVKLLFDSLMKYVTENKIRYSGKRIFYSQMREPGQLQIFASVAVNGPVKADSTDGISKKTMLIGQNLLVADYKGPYKNVSSVYKALDQYKRDYSLVSTAMPFEDFQTAGYGFQPDDSVVLKVCYPIF